MKRKKPFKGDQGAFEFLPTIQNWNNLMKLRPCCVEFLQYKVVTQQKLNSIPSAGNIKKEKQGKVVPYL